MSKPTIKKIENQVIVITGASSGIGLATARMAAERGAKLVLASRNLEDLTSIAQEISASGGKAIAVKADVSKQGDMEALKERALAAFGRIDTWVNNAGASIYGYVKDNPIDEARQVFETNFWGVHYGCMAAIEAMKEKGGVIVNVGSEVSERAISPQTFYSASKHAVKGYTEGLRTELEEKGLPVFLSLVRPAGIDTPFTQHASNHLEDGKEPSLPAPVYHPNVAAKAILACAETGKRDVYVGGASKFFSVLEHVAPGLIDYMVDMKVSADNQKGNLVKHTKANEGLTKAPLREGDAEGGHPGHVMKSSAWTSASLNPGKASLVALGVIGGLFLFSKKAYGRRHPEQRKAA